MALAHECAEFRSMVMAHTIPHRAETRGDANRGQLHGGAMDC